METNRRSTAAKVQVGSMFSRHSFGTVVSLNFQGTGQLQVRNSNGFEWCIDRGVLEQEFSFADQVESEDKYSRTKTIEIVTGSPGTAMTIVFKKKPDHKVVAKELTAGQGDLTDRQWSTKVKNLVEGEERTMVGWHNLKFDEHRRLRFNEIGKGSRLVDLRTVQSVIVNRVKYTVNK